MKTSYCRSSPAIIGLGQPAVKKPTGGASPSPAVDPLRKDDQAAVEQRIAPRVRRLVGYDRDSAGAASTVLQRLYAPRRLQLETGSCDSEAIAR
jgi:hypothetical protein